VSESLLRAASALGGSGKLAEAAALYRQVLQREPRNFDALHALGVIFLRSGRLQDAEQLIAEAVNVNPKAADALYNHAFILMRTGRLEEALDRFTRAVELKPDYLEARGNRAGVLLHLGRNLEALAECDHLVRIRPDLPQGWAVRAGALLALNRPAEALDSLDRAVQRAPSAAGLWVDHAQALVALNRPAEALSSLDRALQIEPKNPVLVLRRADLLAMLKRHSDAITAYDAGLALNPNDSDSWNRRGIALVEIGRDTEAQDSFDRAIRLDPKNIEARNNRANILFEGKRFSEAAREYENVLKAAPLTPYATGFLTQSRLRSCDWRFLSTDRERLSAGLAKGERLIDPQGYLAICRNPEDQWRCARLFIQDEIPPAPPPGIRNVSQDARIRIAYVSADFRPHPVAFLIAGVFEHHDRKQFELTGVSLGHAGSSKIRDRISQAFENFLDAANRTDDDIARELSRRNIDIAVDLNGFTEGCRPGILLRRPASVQVNFLGFPGTMGSPHIDYIIADRLLIPEEERRFYSEQVVYLPHTYQANDSRREVSARVFTRGEAGLPEDGFVFCCFNNNYKITPDIFDVWMRLLAKVQDGVLWLLQDNEDAAANLRREAAARGIAPERLIFASRISPAEHLARQPLGDLFLDTSPYSAHTTCSDALFVGLPVVSFYGPTFPARVAASLLNAVGMSELATNSLGTYEARALFFAQNRGELKAARAKLLRTRSTTPLFDTARFTRGLERAYRQMISIQRQGLGPRSFAVEHNP
jgi:protein O-GlcNAc transferase